MLLQILYTFLIKVLLTHATLLRHNEICRQSDSRRRWRQFVIAFLHPHTSSQIHNDSMRNKFRMHSLVKDAWKLLSAFYNYNEVIFTPFDDNEGVIIFWQRAPALSALFPSKRNCFIFATWIIYNYCYLRTEDVGGETRRRDANTAIAFRAIIQYYKIIKFMDNELN